MDRSPLYDTFARAPLAFERGEGAWLETTDGRRFLDFSGGIAVNVARPRPSGAGRGADRAGREALARLQPLPHPRPGARSPRRSAARPSPTRSSSAIPAPRRSSARSRRRGATTSSAAIPSATASSPSPAPSTAGRWRRSPPPATPNISKGFGPVADGFDQVPLGDIKAVEAAITPGDRGDHDRADPGRGRHPPRRRPVPARARARSATSTACSSSSTRCRPASAAPASSSPTNGRA